MNYMNTAMMILGYCTAGLILVHLAVAFFMFCTECGKIPGPNGPQGWIVSVCRFGVVRAYPDTVLKINCNVTRSTEGREWFLTAPTWFNRYVINIGGVKKVDK